MPLPVISPEQQKQYSAEGWSSFVVQNPAILALPVLAFGQIIIFIFFINVWNSVCGYNKLKYSCFIPLHKIH